MDGSGAENEKNADGENMNFRPTQDFILVRPLERKLTDSPIIAINWEKHCRGEIVAVGPGKRTKLGRLQPLDSKPGDIVAFGNGSFDFYPRVDLNGETFRLIQEADIVFVDNETPDIAQAA